MNPNPYESPQSSPGDAPPAGEASPATRRAARVAGLAVAGFSVQVVTRAWVPDAPWGNGLFFAAIFVASEILYLANWPALDIVRRVGLTLILLLASLGRIGESLPGPE